MKQVRTTAFALTLAVALTLSAGCSARTVSVKSGERVVCTYGEQVSSTVRTIEVPAKEAGEYSVTTRRITCAKHTQLERLYAEAQSALSKRDFASAKKQLAQIVVLDSSFGAAQQQLNDLNKSKTPAPDGASSPGSSAATTPSTPATSTTKPGAGKPGSAKPEGPVASLLVYTPDTLAGYRALPVAADVFSVNREYRAREKGSIVAFVIAAEQQRSTSAAKSWLRDNVKLHYEQSARNVRIDGRDVYMATDGSRFAIIAWAEGPITIAIEAEATGKPSEALADLQSIAAAVVR